MKRMLFAIMAVVVLAGFTGAQDKKPAAAPTQGAQANQQQGAPNPKQAKSKEEYAAYNNAVKLTDPAALEQAATDFAQKYPDSELRGYLFIRATEMYQQTGNSDKTLEVGRKALGIQPNDAVTLAMVASELAEKTKETDLDRDERLAEATKYANEALANVDKIQVPAELTPQQATDAKNQLRAASYSAIAMSAYKKKDYASAEQNFLKAMEAFPNDPEKEYLMLRLTVALDKQAKYPEALEWAKKTQAAASAKQGSPVKDLADQEVARLTPLANRPKTAPAAAPTSPQPQPITPK